jgi:decaprenyl-phosphate phosphoribosyltransferase
MTAGATTESLVHGLWRQARPRQWVKNVLVLAAPGAAGLLDNGSTAWRTSVMVVAFCMVASGGYYWNDILDHSNDRNHPTKQFRPIASGTVPLDLARLVGTVLLAGGIGVALIASWQAAVVAAIYVTLTIVYSAVLKHVAVVDLVVVATFYVLRAIGGAMATDVPMSTWFLLTTSFASLFIVTGKRYAELREVGGDARTRSTLDEYSLDYLRTVLSVSCGASLVTYCMWAFETQEVTTNDWPFYELSIVPMVTAMLRYLLIVEQGHGAAPEEIFVADRTLQILGLIWVVVFGLGVYVAR